MSTEKSVVQLFTLEATLLSYRTGKISGVNSHRSGVCVSISIHIYVYKDIHLNVMKQTKVDLWISQSVSQSGSEPDNQRALCLEGVGDQSKVEGPHPSEHVSASV